VVEKGDTLAKNAARFGLTVMGLKVANGIEEVDLINIGQELVIPSQGVAR